MSGAARHGVILLALTPPHARTDGAARTHLPPWRLTPDVGLASERPAGIRAAHYSGRRRVTPRGARVAPTAPHGMTRHRPGANPTTERGSISPAAQAPQTPAHSGPAFLDAPDDLLTFELGPTVGRETPETTHTRDGDDR
jgi:hypothetical protein